MHNLTFPNAFAEIRKATNNTDLWDSELAWYSQSATHRICLYVLAQGLIVEVVVTREKFPQPYTYSTVLSTVSLLFAYKIFFADTTGFWPSSNP